MEAQGFKIYEHPVIFLFQFLFLLFLSDISFMIAIWFLDLSETQTVLSESNALNMEEKIFIFIMIGQFLFCFYLFFGWIRNFYIFEKNILIHQSGILFIRHERYILEELETVTFSQSFWGRIFSYGKVHIFFANQTITFSKILNPQNFVDLLQKSTTNSRLR